MPGDPAQVIYVWFDALGNYLSALDYSCPGNSSHQRWWVESDERIHVIGKGILRFHAVYWPAFLASAGEVAPTRIHVHPYLSVGGAKISKSSGTTVNPLDFVSRFGIDALRWWFAREVRPVTDTDFSVARLVDTANQDLARGFGNVVNRIVTLIHRYRQGIVPRVDEPSIRAIRQLRAIATSRLVELDLRGATEALLDAVATLNRDVETTSPWSVARDPSRGGELDRVLVRQLRSAGEITAGLEPILPGLATGLARRLTPVAGRLPAFGPAFPLIVP